MEGMTQFLRFERNGPSSIPIIDLQSLSHIIGKHKNKKVALVSSCGSARQGKSFISNFVLRSLLRATDPDAEDDLLDWDNPDQPLTGFAWGNGEERITEGMWITNEAIVLQNSEKEDVAVFLLDSQGVFDEFSTVKESQAILGLSLLLCTSTLFSMKAELHEDKIMSISGTMENLAGTFPENMLNGLLLVVKDWIVQLDCGHGEQGGKRYLERRLQISQRHSPESQHARAVIHREYPQLRAFLMPHPGEKAMSTAFTGSLNEMAPKFTRNLEAFLLSPLLLNLEIANAYEPERFMAKAQALFSTMFPQALKMSVQGTSQSLKMSVSTTPEESIRTLVLEYDQKLREEIQRNDGFMSTEALDEFGKTMLQNVMSLFQPPECCAYKVARAFEQNLETSLEEILKDAKTEVQNTRKELETKLETISKRALAEYEEQVSDINFRWKGGEVSTVTTTRERKIFEETVRQFQENSSKFKAELVKQKQAALENSLKELFHRSVEKQKNKQIQKDNAAYELLEAMLLQEYQETMEKRFQSREEARKFHEKLVASRVTNANLPNESYTERLTESFENEYKKLLHASKFDEDTSASIQDAEKSKEESNAQEAGSSAAQVAAKLLEDRQAVLQAALDMYLKKIGTCISASPSTTVEELKIASSAAVERSAEYIKSVLPQEALTEEALQEFRLMATKTFTEAEQTVQERWKQQEKEVLEAVGNFKEEYKKHIKGACNSTSSEPALRLKHSEIKKALIHDFHDDFPQVKYTQLFHHTQGLDKWVQSHFDGAIIAGWRHHIKSVTLEDQVLAQNVTGMYREAMKKHFKNEPFTKPVDFVLLHENFFRKCCTKYGKSNLDIQQKIQEALKPLYTKYCEKNNMNTPGAPAIGIDLGTTYCCVAIYQHGKVNIIPNEFGNNTIPSFIALLPSGELIGENAKLQAHENPTQTIFDSKRLIGRKFNEKEVLADMALWPFKVVDDLSIPKIEVTGRKYAAEVVSAKLLKHIKNVAEKYLKGTEVKNAVITVPAYFNDGQRQATKDAAEIAGLNVLQIINEPTAAAIAYHLHRTEAGSHNVLVYDLGGGTFDVSVLTMNGGKIEVKAVGGDTHLGGEDFDQALVNHCVIKFQQQHGINLAQGRGSLREIEVAQASRTLRRLRNECENRKKDLSSSPSTTIAVATIHGHLDLNIPLTRVEFENLNIARFNQTIGIVQKALADAKIRKEEIHEVVLVGGSTRIPKVRELLKAFFNGKELCTSVNADEAVAYGAAIQAAILNGCQEQKLQRISLKDVTPMSLGIEVIGERHSVIIPRNTSVPADRTQTYTTTSDYQTQIRVAIYEGEDPAATRNYLLGEFLLTGLPAKRRGVEKVLVTMKVDAEGILHVSAVCTSNKVFGNITIVEHKGRLTRAEIEEERKYLQEEVP